ncbi:hypothetical protein ACP26L_22405 [Paenibacillus sp. S-38]|uniref:hypothetical protein n=1 Tax=Paenibacillus sp. S-38 TaxID=3416710 RepID=UPI003CF9541D
MNRKPSERRLALGDLIRRRQRAGERGDRGQWMTKRSVPAGGNETPLAKDMTNRRSGIDLPYRLPSIQGRSLSQPRPYRPLPPCSSLQHGLPS